MEESEQVAEASEAKDAPFKAPPVIKVEKRTEGLLAPDNRQKPEEASKPKKKRKGPSLFERMTGVGRMSRNAEAERADRQTAEQAPKETVRTEPVAPRPQAEAPVTAPAPQKQEALSPSVRIEQKNEDEDLLDIPAFLRRQAN